MNTLPRALLLSSLAMAAVSSAWAQVAVPPVPTPVPTPVPMPDIDAIARAAERAASDLLVQLPPLPPPPPAPLARVPFGGDRAQVLYDAGRDAIERGRYDQAVQRFDQLIEMKAKQADAALYWKAYSLERLGDRGKALTALADLQKQFAASRWIKDAKALELEVRQASGQSVSPDAQNNEELKLLALRGLMQTDPDQALPVLEKMLNGNEGLRVKEQALFVLSQSRAARAREIMAGLARSTANPDLQLRAIRYLGMLRATPELVAAYQGDPSAEVRRAVANALFLGREAGALVGLAKVEKDPELKRELVRKLSLMKDKAATDYMLELLK